MSFARSGALLCVAAISLAAVSLAASASIKVTSPAFHEGGDIPARFTCSGANDSPPLHFEMVPSAAKSLVLVVDDPDAPGGLFTHWLVWNLDAKTTEIGEKSAPKGTTGRNDFGKTAYGGPCPPSGTHRYYFKVFALDTQLSLAAGAKRAQLDAAMRGHVVGQGQLMGRYGAAH